MWAEVVAGVVVLPSRRLQAEPAEAVAARRRAPHVVAALVLLDGAAASGARLGVRHHPVGRLRRVGAVLEQPRAHRGARHRPVRLLAAGPADSVPAHAEHVRRRVTAARRLQRAGAPGAAAPPHPPAALLHVRPEPEPRVPAHVVRRQHLVHELPDDGRRAARVRAPQRQAARAVAHRRADVPAPAPVAVVVGAARGRRLPRGLLVEADGADARPQAARRGDELARGKAGGAAHAPLVREPLLLDPPDAPLEVAQQDGREARRDGQHLGDPGGVRLLPRADVVLGQNGVPLLPVARRGVGLCLLGSSFAVVVVVVVVLEHVILVAGAAAVVSRFLGMPARAIAIGALSVVVVVAAGSRGCFACLAAAARPAAVVVVARAAADLSVPLVGDSAAARRHAAEPRFLGEGFGLHPSLTAFWSVDMYWWIVVIHRTFRPDFSKQIRKSKSF
uniref:Uncharacterized protein n=1 Tax=Zea mays TaxID=4577 RepID=A0A804NJL0_MAIZE